MDYNNGLLNLCYLIVKKGYGIELKWSEKAALKNYLESWSEASKTNTHVDNYMSEGLNSFMREYFDLETTEISSRDGERLFPDGRLEVVEVGGEWFKTPEFKTYCQDRIQMWRDERELI